MGLFQHSYKKVDADQQNQKFVLWGSVHQLYKSYFHGQHIDELHFINGMNRDTWQIYNLNHRWLYRLKISG
jgi:hypothetical protein